MSITDTRNREATNPHAQLEAEQDLDEDEGDDAMAKIKKEFAMDNNLWSYSFHLNNIDDFQITMPNPNGVPLPLREGWSLTEGKAFSRVNISPGPDHDATLFISFSKPCKDI